MMNTAPQKERITVHNTELVLGREWSREWKRMRR